MALTPQQVNIYRRMPAARKLQIAADFNRSARELKAAALRAQHPEWSDEQVRRKVRDVFLYASS